MFCICFVLSNSGSLSLGAGICPLSALAARVKVAFFPKPPSVRPSVLLQRPFGLVPAQLRRRRRLHHPCLPPPPPGLLIHVVLLPGGLFQPKPRLGKRVAMCVCAASEEGKFHMSLLCARLYRVCVETPTKKTRGDFLKWISISPHSSEEGGRRRRVKKGERKRSRQVMVIEREKWPLCVLCRFCHH